MALELIFRGTFSSDTTREEAAEYLGKLFQQPVAEIERRLFSGRAVRIKTVQSQAEAERYVRAFAKAGLTLEVRQGSHGERTEAQTPVKKAAPAAASPTRSSTPGKRHYGIPAVAAVLVMVVAAGAWFTQPIWRAGDTSEAEISAARALATDRLIALGHLDVDRAVQLQERLFGMPDADALLAGDSTDQDMADADGSGPDSMWVSLQRADIEPTEHIDDVLMALYGDDESSHWAILTLGKLDATKVRGWIESRYDVARFDGQTDTIYFSWLDDATCEASPLHAARIGPSSVLVAPADEIDALWTRLETSASPQTGIDEWLEQSSRQLLTAGVFQPASMGQAADGMAGMMLAAAGEAATPAEALFFGVSPALMPPGVVLSGTIASDDRTFLDETYGAATAWLDSAKASAQTSAQSTELLDLYERVTVTREDRTLRAGVRLDTDVDDELQRLLGALFQQAFSMAPSQDNPGAPTTDKVADKVDESPTMFAAAARSQLKPYSAFGDGFFQPQWQEGPFALAVSKLAVNEQGQLEISLRGEGRSLPNLGARSKLVRARITEVSDPQGQTLLPVEECGPRRNRAWSDAGMVSEGSHFVDGELINYPTVSLEKTLTLIPDAAPQNVSTIRGEIEYRMPTRIRKVKVDVPLDGKVVEGSDVRLQFQPGSDRSISYQASGRTGRLLAVRALNGHGQVLANGGVTWGDNWFGPGEHVSMDIQGQIAAVEVVLAEEMVPVSYPFVLPTAYPSIEDRQSRSAPPSVPSGIDASELLTRAMGSEPPAVTFTYHEPEAKKVVGPGLVAVDRLQVSPYMGLVAQLALYVPQTMPLDGQLNGGSIMLDRAELESGEFVDLELGGPVSLSAEGAYWLNGEYRVNPDKPWLKGQLSLQSSEYDSTPPVRVHGRILLRAARSTQSVEVAVAPGSVHVVDGADRADQYRIEVSVVEWRENAMTLDIAVGGDRVLSIMAIDADGNPVGRANRLDNARGKTTARVDLTAIPTTLKLLIADEMVEHERTFSIDV